MCQKASNPGAGHNGPGWFKPAGRCPRFRNSVESSTDRRIPFRTPSRSKPSRLPAHLTHSLPPEISFSSPRSCTAASDSMRLNYAGADNPENYSFSAERLASAQGRDREMKGRAMLRVRRRPEPASVRLDDRTADRQAHAHAAALGGEECIEDLSHARLIETHARILHGHDHVVVVWPRANDDLARPVADRRHRLHAVHHEVDENLRQLDPI